MASQIYNEFKRASAAGEIDLDADAVYAILVMSNTTADTENDGIVNVGDLSTLDEFDGTNYSRKKLSTTAVNKDDGNDRAEFDADDVTWSSLGAGTRDAVGVLLYKDPDDDGASADDASNPVIAFVEFASAATPDGSDFTVEWSVEGILQLS